MAEPQKLVAGPQKRDAAAFELPSGWTKRKLQRTSGKSAGKWDTYYYNPAGDRFRTQGEVMKEIQQVGAGGTLRSDPNLDAGGVSTVQVVGSAQCQKTHTPHIKIMLYIFMLYMFCKSSRKSIVSRIVSQVSRQIS